MVSHIIPTEEQLACLITLTVLAAAIILGHILNHLCRVVHSSWTISQITFFFLVAIRRLVTELWKLLTRLICHRQPHEGFNEAILKEALSELQQLVLNLEHQQQIHNLVSEGDEMPLVQDEISPQEPVPQTDDLDRLLKYIQMYDEGLKGIVKEGLVPEEPPIPRHSGVLGDVPDGLPSFSRYDPSSRKPKGNKFDNSSLEEDPGNDADDESDNRK